MTHQTLTTKDWPHAPVHRLDSAGIFIVTAATLYKKHLFCGAEKLSLLENALLSLAKRYQWQLEAWSIFSNHYHFIGRNYLPLAAPERFLNHLHADTARAINRLDGAVGRQVWFNYWDTKLTFERSYLARLNYVHQNPVKHGLVLRANQYPWCSASWFERTASPAMLKTIYSFKTDLVRVYDDF
jgi:putative transposase